MATINGTSGNDTLNGTSGDDTINGLAGDDTIDAGDGNDLIDGGDGDDSLFGGGGDDLLNGGAGNDLLDGGEGSEAMDGGAGMDTVSFAAANHSIYLILESTAPRDTGQGVDSIINIENVVGSAFDDFLDGTHGDNRIDGGPGNDIIVGGGGSDVLIGGSGNDQFLCGTGSGHVTITDLTPGDRIYADGYAATQSITQVGNDVVIVYSDADQITCLNTTTAAVQAALPHPSTFVQPPSTIIPQLPPRPASTTVTGTTVLAATTTVSADQVYYGVDIDPTFSAPGTYFRAGWGSPLIFGDHSPSFDVHLTNFGTIWDASAVNYTNTLWVDQLTNAGTIVAEVGTFIPEGAASMQYFTARAVVVLSGATIGTEIFRNSGSIFSIATSGVAFGVYSEDGMKSSFVNTGLIAVRATYGTDHSQSGGAQGIHMENGGNFLNDVGGQILVEGDGLAYAVYQGRGSHPAFDLGPEIVNRGLIQAVVGSDSFRPSVGIFAVNMPTELMRIVNSGTIDADIAIYCPSDPHDAFTTSWIINPQTVTNEATGIVLGDIQLNLGDDTLLNFGLIRGTVDMGGDNDLVDNSAGTIDGVVLMGEGTDNFIGGAAADHASGGVGNDTITGGGGADLLEGNFGDDALVGGAGNDGLYGGTGNDALHTSGGDVAHGNWGNDQIDTSDWSFAQIDGGSGYDQWVLALGARALDLGIVGASGRVIGIEEIDLRGSQSVVVHAADVSAISGGDTLHLRGAATDSVYLSGSWSNLGSVVENGVTYARYQSDASFVLVESGVVVTIGNSAPAAGGLDAIAGGDAAPLPSADAESNVLWISRFALQSDLFISADEIWKSSDGAVPLAFAYIPTGGQLFDPPDVVNYGQIINDVGIGGFVIAAGNDPDAASVDSFGLFSNYGTIRAETNGATTGASAFVAGARGTLVNDGDIIAIAHGSGDATGVVTFDSGFEAPSVTNHAAGYIGAFSQSGFATGIFAVNSPDFVNNGVIEVQGATGSIGVDQFNAGGSLINTGSIIASITPGGDGVSIGYAHDNVGGGGLTNSGVISADIAVFFQTRYGEMFTINNSGTIEGAIVWNIWYLEPGYTFGRLNMTNSGTIVGNIVADPTSTGIETIVNTGLITGDMHFYGGTTVTTAIWACSRGPSLPGPGPTR